MTASEKRYFKIYAGKSGGKGGQNYLFVFDSMEKMASYDEKAFLKSISDEKLKRQFPVVKNYLYKLILKSLRNFHSDQSLDFQIRELLLNADILLQRNLPRQAAKQLNKAEKLAQANERFEYFPEIGAMQVSLAMKIGQDDLDQGAKDIEGIFEQTNSYFKAYQQLEHYRLLSLRLLFLSRKETVIRSEELRIAYSKIMQDPFLTADAPEKPLKSRVFYLQCHFIDRIAHSDFHRAYGFVSEVLEIMEENPWMIADRPENYVNSLQNQVAISTLVNEWEVTRPLLDKMKNIASRFPKVKFGRAALRRVPLYAYNTEIHQLIALGKYEETIPLIPEARKFVEDVRDYEVNVNEGFILLSLWLNLVHVHILLGRFKEALRYLDLILDSDKVSGDYEVYRDARVLRVIVLFEMGDEEMLDHALLSLYRFLRKREKLYRFEMAWIEFIRKSVRRGPDDSLREMFAKLRKDLKELQEDPAEKRLLTNFDMVGWLDKKIQKW